MMYNPEDLALLAEQMSEKWSNGACRGYVIMAMENCDFSDKDIRRVMAELRELFNFGRGGGSLSEKLLLTSRQKEVNRPALTHAVHFLP